MISRLASSILLAGCVLVLPGCDSFSANNTSNSTPISPTVASPAPSGTPALIVPVNNPSQPNNPVNTPPATQPSTTPNRTLNLKLRFSAGGVIHEGALTINGDSGQLLTRFFDANSNQTATVEQTIKVENTPEGLALWGYDPVYPGTQTPYPTYIPDNFILGVNPDGSKNLRTCDDAGNCSDVEIIDN